MKDELPTGAIRSGSVSELGSEGRTLPSAMGRPEWIDTDTDSDPDGEGNRRVEKPTGRNGSTPIPIPTPTPRGRRDGADVNQRGQATRHSLRRTLSAR
jgi:hypothetical protein